MKSLLVDSSAYIDLMRAGVDVRQRLLPFLREGVLYNSGVVRAEVLRGMKVPKARDGMEAFFDIIPEVPADARLWRAVSLLGWELGRKGKWPPVTDLVIAVSALRVGARLVSPDAHFEDVPGLEIIAEIPEP
jgi:predicted nucleic acid-binding protein